jgi:cystathionine beta-lyase/cystathionine gamma-synthase
MNQKNVGLNTILNHPRKVVMPSGNEPLLSPIYQTSKFVMSPDHSFHDQFIYTRISNPTLKELENHLADITKKEECQVFASGISAITISMLALLKKGDHVISFKESYKPTRLFIRDVLPRYGIETSLISLNDFNMLEKIIQPGVTKIIHFESPTNPNLKIADIDKLIEFAKRHQILLSMDGTFAGLHQHHYSSINLIIHSLTKFANGHGDVMAGAVMSSAQIMKSIRSMAIFMGSTLDPHAAFLISRGLKTYLLRYERQTKTAEKVAIFLSQHPKIKKVYYPGLKNHENYELAQKQMVHMGSMISFVLDSKGMDAKKFSHELKLIQFSVSLGATESIICPSLYFFGDDLSEKEREELDLNPFSLRLSIGLEDEEDIINDLKRVLDIA